MVTIHQALAKVKADLANMLNDEAIFICCREHGHRWRRTRLNPAVTLHLFILQVLGGNVSCWALRHLSGLTLTASAYCQARQRLPLAVIRELARQVGGYVRARGDAAGLWRGHRLWLVDGSGVSMPDTPELQKHFGQPAGQREGCGFPVASVLLLVHAASGAIVDLLLRPLRVHDMSGVARLHADLGRGDVLVGDRAFSSYVHLCLLTERGLHGIFRLHQRTIVSFRRRRRHARQFPRDRRRGRPTAQWLQGLGPDDQRVRCFKPRQRPGWMSARQFAALPDSLPLRQLRYRVHQRGFRVREVLLVTTLLDAGAYPADELAQKFRERWSIEGNFDHLKTTLGAAVLHSKTVAGVAKELWVFVLGYNLVRQVMLEAAERQGVDPGRISFADALRWLAWAPAGREFCALVVNPRREGRFEPRVVKRRMKEYPLLKKPRAALRQELAGKRVAA